MRRTLPVLITATVLFTACGDSDPSSSADDTTATEAEGETDATAAATDVDEDPATDSDDSVDEPATDSENPADSAAAESTEPAAADAELAPPPTNPDKPTDIAFPGAAPEKLEITVLEAGTGPEAVLGDTVIVDYIGVRSLDGVEFDNSYDRFTPFSVGPLGQANVIQGWNDGLLGAQTGSQIQLDIPSELAYGEAARDETIRENEPLTFVIDVRAVIAVSDPADQPTEPGTELSEGALEVIADDLVEGDGAVLEIDQTAVFDFVMFRGDNGVTLTSTWGSEPTQLPMAVGNFPGLVEGMPGMAVGGRRAITIPPEQGYGPEGNPPLGLPADTDIIIVVDLLGLY